MAKKISLLPTEVNLVLYAGDGARFSISVTDAANNAIPVDGSVKAQIRETRQDLDPATEFDVDLTNGAQGIFILSLPGENAAGLIDDSGNKFAGVWDVEWTPVNEEPVTLVQGNVEVHPDVTR